MKLQHITKVERRTAIFGIQDKKKEKKKMKLLLSLMIKINLHLRLFIKIIIFPRPSSPSRRIIRNWIFFSFSIIRSLLQLRGYLLIFLFTLFLTFFSFHILNYVFPVGKKIHVLLTLQILFFYYSQH